MQSKDGKPTRAATATLTKAGIVDSVSVRLECSRADAGDYVEAVLNAMKETLEAGNVVKVSGFGNFEVRDKTPRPGRNPLTGEPFTIAARRVLTFKASKVLRDVLND